MSAEDLPREVMRHGFQIQALQESVMRGDATMTDIRKDVDKLEESHSRMEKSFDKWVSAAEATERHAQKIANQAITAKQLYVSTGALVVAILGLVLGLKA